LPPRFLVAAGAFFERDGDARSALELYEKVASQAPSDPASLRALFRRGEILRKGGDLGAARDAYARTRAHPACDDTMRQTVARALAEVEARPSKRPT
jgi:predicted TPR repeat methyltransferase